MSAVASRLAPSPPLVLGAALPCVSSAAILVRSCESGFLAVVFWRLALATAVAWLPALVSGTQLRERLGVLASTRAAGAGL